MVELPTRSRVGDEPRAAVGREWEVFVRQTAEEPLRHVGSVTASVPDEAYEHATRLFAWYAADVWICPADETRRYSTHDLDENAEPVPLSSGDEARTYEG
ncbi:Htur_1727 family rSAM-partnered candidate RiPP [Halegenticoccus tardaugens]|uniref:Htur_1727 family rSAM-partnered candidate RiPP n=1 Tax=Halegenticoccus tardaugens TaxID=2071624 RepID=UPI00100B4991|nr:Htur_1727 family rSAM-partnered candidate RiPP [Halegenticoccus tardaugens]